MLIVTYHDVGARNSAVAVTAERLARDVSELRDAGFSFVSLDDCADWIEGRHQLDDNSIALTFDDGYESVARVALPLLNRLDVPFALFVIAGRIGGDNQWPGQWRSVGPAPLIDAAQLRDLVVAGATIGAHTWSHPDLTALDERDLQAQIVDAGDRLEQIADRPIRHFAYPYGLRGAREIGIARSRYRTAVSSEPGVVDRTSALHDLPRLDCHDLRIGVRLRLTGAGRLRTYLAARRRLRRLRRRIDRVTA